MNQKRGRTLVASLLAVVLIISALLTGCNTNNNTNKDTDNVPITKDESNQPEHKKEGERAKITVPFINFGVIPSEEGTPTDNRWTQWIQENAPVDVEFVDVPVGQRIEKYNAMFAAGEAPDLIMTFGDDFIAQLIDQKLVMPIDDLIENYSTNYKELLNEFPEIRQAATKTDGHMYSIARVVGVKTNPAIVIREDWLQKLSLEIPKTTEELYTVAEAFAKQDPDGNGKDDTYGIGLSQGSRYAYESMFGVNDYYDRNGELVRDSMPRQQYIEFIKKLYDNGIVDKDFLTDKDGAKESQDFLTGKLGITLINQASRPMGFNTFKSFLDNNSNGSYTVIELPESPNGQYSPHINPPFEMFVMVNSQTKNPEAVMKYIDFLLEDQTGIILSYGFKGEHWELGDNGCPNLLDADKYAKEVGWNKLYWEWIFPELKFGPCREFASTLNPDDPVEKKFIEFTEKHSAAYLSKERPIKGLTFGLYMPQIPKDLNQIRQSTSKTIQDILDKALVSGSSYSAEQAVKDADKVFYGSGGEKIDQWHNDWYKAHKDEAFLIEEIYAFLEKQQELGKAPSVKFE